MQQNNERKPQVQTFGFKSANEDTQTCLAVRYFESTAGIGIHVPLKGGDKGYTQYDYKNGAFAYLQPRDCKALHKKGMKVLRTYEETGNFEAFAIPLKRGLLEFAAARDLKKKLKQLTGDVNPTDICAVVYTNTDDQKRTEEYMVHVFNQDKIVKNYDPSSGGYDVEFSNSEFEYFLDAMNEFALAMTNGYIHASNHENRYARARLEQNVFSLMQALNVDISKPMASKGGNSGNGSRSNWSGGSNTISNRGNGGSTHGQEIEVDNPTDEELDRIIAQMSQED
jgi:hypothetical protein